MRLSEPAPMFQVSLTTWSSNSLSYSTKWYRWQYDEGICQKAPVKSLSIGGQAESATEGWWDAAEARWDVIDAADDVADASGERPACSSDSSSPVHVRQWCDQGRWPRQLRSSYGPSRVWAPQEAEHSKQVKSYDGGIGFLAVGSSSKSKWPRMSLSN